MKTKNMEKKNSSRDHGGLKTGCVRLGMSNGEIKKINVRKP